MLQIARTADVVALVILAVCFFFANGFAPETWGGRSSGGTFPLWSIFVGGEHWVVCREQGTILASPAAVIGELSDRQFELKCGEVFLASNNDWWREGGQQTVPPIVAAV